MPSKRRSGSAGWVGQLRLNPKTPGRSEVRLNSSSRGAKLLASLNRTCTTPDYPWEGRLSVERVERGLVAISRDGRVGYSRVIGRDEAGKLAYEPLPCDLVDPKFAEHKGRIVNAGD